MVNISSLIEDGTHRDECKENDDHHMSNDENHRMTTIVDTTKSPAVPPPPPQQQQQKHVYNHTMTLDDGTGTIIDVHVTYAMIQHIQLQIGMIVDAMVRVVLPAFSWSTTQQHNHNTRCFMADQIVVQDSTKETLRWLELSYQASLQQQQQRLLSPSSSSPSKNHIMSHQNNPDMDLDHDTICHDDHHTTASSFSSPPLKSTTQSSSQWMGYPTRDLSSEDIYRIIASECEFASCQNTLSNSTTTTPAEQYPTTATNRNISSSSSTNTGVTGGGGGVSLQDLADCFDYSTAYIGTLVQELQNSGQIYQNENGLYTLL